VSRKQILRRASSPIACAVTDGASGQHPASTATEAPLISLAAAAGGHPLLFRQLFDADTGTFT
jgi:hypothetical protein